MFRQVMSVSPSFIVLNTYLRKPSSLHRFFAFIGCALNVMLFFGFRCLLRSTLATLAAFCRWYERLLRPSDFEAVAVAASMSTSEDMHVSRSDQCTNLSLHACQGVGAGATVCLCDWWEVVLAGCEAEFEFAVGVEAEDVGRGT